MYVIVVTSCDDADGGAKNATSCWHVLVSRDRVQTDRHTPPSPLRRVTVTKHCSLLVFTTHDDTTLISGPHADTGDSKNSHVDTANVSSTPVTVDGISQTFSNNLPVSQQEETNAFPDNVEISTNGLLPLTSTSSKYTNYDRKLIILATADTGDSEEAHISSTPKSINPIYGGYNLPFGQPAETDAKFDSAKISTQSLLRSRGTSSRYTDNSLKLIEGPSDTDPEDVQFSTPVSAENIIPCSVTKSLPVDQPADLSNAGVSSFCSLLHDTSATSKYTNDDLRFFSGPPDATLDDVHPDTAKVSSTSSTGNSMETRDNYCPLSVGQSVIGTVPYRSDTSANTSTNIYTKHDSAADDQNRYSPTAEEILTANAIIPFVQESCGNQTADTADLSSGCGICANETNDSRRFSYVIKMADVTNTCAAPAQETTENDVTAAYKSSLSTTVLSPTVEEGPLIQSSLYSQPAETNSYLDLSTSTTSPTYITKHDSDVDDHSGDRSSITAEAMLTVSVSIPVVHESSGNPENRTAATADLLHDDDQTTTYCTLPLSTISSPFAVEQGSDVSDVVQSGNNNNCPLIQTSLVCRLITEANSYHDVSTSTSTSPTYAKHGSAFDDPGGNGSSPTAEARQINTSIPDFQESPRSEKTKPDLSPDQTCTSPLSAIYSQPVPTTVEQSSIADKASDHESATDLDYNENICLHTAVADEGTTTSIPDVTDLSAYQMSTYTSSLLTPGLSSAAVEQGSNDGNSPAVDIDRQRDGYSPNTTAEEAHMGHTNIPNFQEPSENQTAKNDSSTNQMATPLSKICPSSTTTEKSSNASKNHNDDRYSLTAANDKRTSTSMNIPDFEETAPNHPADTDTSPHQPSAFASSVGLHATVEQGSNAGSASDDSRGDRYSPTAEGLHTSTSIPDVQKSFQNQIVETYISEPLVSRPTSMEQEGSDALDGVEGTPELVDHPISSPLEVPSTDDDDRQPDVKNLSLRQRVRSTTTGGDSYTPEIAKDDDDVTLTSPSDDQHHANDRKHVTHASNDVIATLPPPGDQTQQLDRLTTSSHYVALT